MFLSVYWQGGSAKVSAGVKSLAFDSSGVLVWVGDEKVLHYYDDDDDDDYYYYYIYYYY